MRPADRGAVLEAGFTRTEEAEQELCLALRLWREC